MKKNSPKILMLGFGSVAQCTLPILIKELAFSPAQITVLDMVDKRAALAAYLAQGLTFVQDELTKDNLPVVLKQYLKAKDILIDLTWNIDTVDFLNWCHANDVLYINTSVEIWNPYEHYHNQHPTQRTLYWRHLKINEAIKKWQTKGPTMVVDHGANPGLISHMTKQGLLDIAAKGLKDKKWDASTSQKIKEAMASQSWNHLAMALGVKVIHVSERDTQVTNQPKAINEFVNTWSIQGFHEEGTTTAELGWGTHEKEYPVGTFHHQEGPKNQICLARMGINTLVRSVVPGSTIQGMVIRHGEAFTLSRLLTVNDANQQPIYRPTLHYAYCPCDSAIASLHELRGNHYELQPKLRIMSDEITGGADILGALIMGHPYQSWWIGSNLSIEEARRLVPHQNATTIQVAVSVVSALSWMIEYPSEGFCTPEDLPFDYILKKAKPYLGEWISQPIDWNPLKGYEPAFKGYSEPSLDLTDPWQFKNFLIQD